MTADLSKIRYM